MPSGTALGLVRCAHRKVAIIGAGLSRALAPWDDSSYCFWALNEIYQEIFCRHFELHPRSKQNAHELAWLAQCPTPCYVLDLDEWDGLIPHAVEYPLARVLAMPGARDWFTSTFSYQAALAVLEGFAEIGVWGVDLRRGTLRERTVEWAGLAWWLGYAAGRGVRVTLPPDEISWSHPGRYGYDYDREKTAVERQMDDLRDVCASWAHPILRLR